jgi:transcriptional regulator with XRE-family HTH domain
MTIFNTHRILTALNNSELLVSELAYRVDIAISTLERILNGNPDPGEIRIATLVKIADNLGLPLASLFAPPPEPPPAHEGPARHRADQAAADAATVIATIYDRGSAPTRNAELAEVLGWDLDRLKAAYQEADLRLRPAGLRLVREHGEATIQPVADHTDTRLRLKEVRAADRGFDLSHYKAAYQAYTGQAISVSNRAAQRRRITAPLANLGVLTEVGSKAAFTQAARYAHPL